MKHSGLVFALISVLAFTELKSQASFTLAPNLCEGAIVSASVDTGTLSALMYSWAAIPSTGVVFSSTSTQTTTISFTLAGTYTIGAGFLTGTGFSYTTNVIVIDPVPTLTVSPASAAICAGASATFIASGTGTSYAWAPATSINTLTGATVISTPASNITYTVISSLGNCSTTKTLAVSVTPVSTISIVPSAASVCVGFTSTLTALGSSNYTWTSPTLTAPVSQQSVAVSPGAYTVTSGSGTCAATASFTVGLLPNLTPSITVSPASMTTCITNNFPKYSKPVTLTASGAGTFVWFPYVSSQQPSTGPIVTVRPAATTCYTLVGSTAICSGTAVVCINVIPQFTAAVTPSAPVTCLDDHTNLAIVNVGAQATGPASAFMYSWTEALNAPPLSMSDYFSSTTTIHPQNATTYTAEVRDAQECISAQILVNVMVNACVGIEKQNARELQFQIHPNPANDKLFIQTATNSLVLVEILDAMGKVVLKENRNFSGEAMKQSFNIASLPAGIYFVRINSDNMQAKVMRLIKN